MANELIAIEQLTYYNSKLKAYLDTLLSTKADDSDIPTELSQLAEDSTHRLVTDADITAWNNKVDKTTQTYKLYGTSGTGSAQLWALAYTVSSANQVPLADENGRLKILAPIADNNPTTKLYVDNGLSGKQNTLTFDNTPTSGSTNPVTSGGVYTALDEKLNKSSIADRIYGTNGSGAQTMFIYSYNNYPGSVAMRSTGGVLTVGTPTANDHATTKKYVDDNLPVIRDWTV